MSSKQGNPGRDCVPVVETRFGDARTPSLALVEAVAEAKDTTPTELDPLSQWVDLDAIDALFGDRGRESATSTVVQVAIAEWAVFLRGDGAIRVYESTPGEARAVRQSLAD